jgi:hypothetical protein
MLDRGTRGSADFRPLGIRGSLLEGRVLLELFAKPSALTLETKDK